MNEGIASIAPAGQTWLHFAQSTVQYPLSNAISGWPKSLRRTEGRSTLLGHAFTQSWQPTHFVWKFFIECDPAGLSEALRTSIPGSDTSAKPPSNIFSSAASAASAAPAAAVPTRKLRRVTPSDADSFASWLRTFDFEHLTPDPIAPLGQSTVQSRHCTHNVASISPPLPSILIADARHVRSHCLQPMHFASSIFSLNRARRESPPRKVPTGHTQLHHTRPRHAARANIATPNVSAIQRLVAMRPKSP